MTMVAYDYGKTVEIVKHDSTGAPEETEEYAGVDRDELLESLGLIKLGDWMQIGSYVPCVDVSE